MTPRSRDPELRDPELRDPELLLQLSNPEAFLEGIAVVSGSAWAFDIQLVVMAKSMTIHCQRLHA